MEWTVFPGNEGFGKKGLLRLEGKFLTFPREGNFTSSHFFASKDVWGGEALRLLNALNSEDRGWKVCFSLAMIVFETFELILCQMLSSQGKNAPSNPYPHYLVRLATSRGEGNSGKKKAYTALLQSRTSLCRKNGVHRGKISVVDMVFLVFIGFLYPPPAWKVFF